MEDKTVSHREAVLLAELAKVKHERDFAREDMPDLVYRLRETDRLFRNAERRADAAISRAERAEGLLAKVRAQLRDTNPLARLLHGTKARRVP